MRLLVRAAIRRFRLRPVSSAAVAGTLTIAIGANTAIFSAIDAILLRPLPYPSPDRLVSVYESNETERRATSLVAPIRLEEWNRLSSSFDGLAGSFFENVTDTTGPLPERVAAMRVSPRFFSVLGVAAEAGRTPGGGEERFGGPPVVVLSDRFWRARFNADPSLVGRSLRLGGVNRTVIGVMPPSFRYPDSSTDVWMPAQLPPALFAEAREARFYRAVGRLRAAVSTSQAQQDLAAVQSSLGREHPKTDRGWSATVMPLAEEQVAGVRRSLWLLLGAVALVLMAACGNIACVMLAEASAREHEIAMRFALGARRITLVRQLLAEGLGLAAAGTLTGLLLARWAIAGLRGLAATLPRADDIHIDARIMLFAVSVGASTTLIFSLAPAVYATRRDVGERLARAGRTQVRGAQVIQRLLVAAQMALAVVLLAGSGLLLRSFARLQHVPPGFDSRGVLTFRVSAQWAETSAALMNRQVRTVERLKRIPGVQSAAFSSLVPAGLDLPPGEFSIVGRRAGERLFAHGRQVSAEYFRVLSIPILNGETCRDDPADAPFTKVLVTRAFAMRFFPGEDPIGHSIVRAMPAGIDARIIGIVGDVRENGLAHEPPPLIYTCGMNPYWPDPYYLLRISPGQVVSLAAVREALRDVDAGRAVYDVAWLDERLSATVATPRLNTLLLGLFAAMGMLLAAVGLYGVLSQFVAVRRRDIGVRLALGAPVRHIAARIAWQAAAPTALGLAMGLASAFWAARIMAGLLFGVSPHDLQTFIVVPAALSSVAAAATAIPARRAMRIEPSEALKEQ